MSHAELGMAERAGESLRAFQDRTVPDVAAGGPDVAALVSGAKLAHKRAVTRKRAAVGAGLVLAASGLFGILAPDALTGLGNTTRGAMTYAVDEGEPRADLGRRISAGAEQKSLSFAEAEFVLDAEASAKVESLRKAEVELRLVAGSIQGEVEPDTARIWTVRAGRYAVRVVGTLFDMSLDPKSGRFEVGVKRGVVEVTGPPIDGARRLGAGERLVFEETSPGEPLPSEVQQVEVQAPDSDGKRLARLKKSAPAKNPGKSWQSLAKKGRYKDSLAAVEAQNFDRVVSSLSVAELVQLADVARMAGKSSRATALLHRIRAKAPGTSQAAMAAYSLGTTAFDQRGDFVTAARWFRAYLAEQPSGPLAREALGRAMEAQHRSGSSARARSSAEIYLKRYPKGPHRRLAASLLQLK